ncbi:MAG: outer membrane protein assembly factor BamD [Candidatus Eisenbacteria bacterium]|nr:outer membrane protein assembly factor BamD [Candidatus Eisenbacteria bacterium]
MTTPSRRLTVALSLGLIVAAFFGCSPMPDLSEATAESAYEAGVAAMAAEDYLIAVEAFRRVTDTYPLSPEADDALLGLADAHRAVREYALAENEYLRLTQEYPESPLVPEARYKLGVTYYEQSLPASLDQTMTRRALSQLNSFLATYPASAFASDAEELVDELRARLAEKLFLSAELYLSLNDVDAAGVYFEQVVEDYPDTPWAPRALRTWERSLREAGETARADEVRGRLDELYPEEAGEPSPQDGGGSGS